MASLHEAQRSAQSQINMYISDLQVGAAQGLRCWDVWLPGGAGGWAAGAAGGGLVQGLPVSSLAAGVCPGLSAHTWLQQCAELELMPCNGCLAPAGL